MRGAFERMESLALSFSSEAVKLFRALRLGLSSAALKFHPG